jgi:hypothetical protein
MLMDMLAMLTTGAAMAGLVLALTRGLKLRLPRWSLPAGIAAGMLGYTIWAEYSWFPRIAAALEPAADVVLAPAETSPFRPWTFLAPLTTRLIALDQTSLQISAERPEIRQVTLMVIERWQPLARVPMAFDCAGGRQATLIDGAAVSPDGTLTGATWVTPSADDPLQGPACGLDLAG